MVAKYGYFETFGTTKGSMSYRLPLDNFLIHIAAVTDVGRKRTNNEDNCTLQDNLLAVCDGMGGHEKGEVASKLACEFFAKESNAGVSLNELAHGAHQYLCAYAQQNPDTAGMGTTGVVARFVDSKRVQLTNVGDSRAYVYRREKGNPRLEQLTEDHSLIWNALKNGKIEKDAMMHANNNNILTVCLGTEEDSFSVDEVKQIERPIRVGDVYLLCSDGLWGMLTDNEIGTILAESYARDPTNDHAAAQALVDAANAAGGKDNITVALARVNKKPFSFSQLYAQYISPSFSALQSRLFTRKATTVPAEQKGEQHASLDDSNADINAIQGMRDFDELLMGYRGLCAVSNRRRIEKEEIDQERLNWKRKYETTQRTLEAALSRTDKIRLYIADIFDGIQQGISQWKEKQEKKELKTAEKALDETREALETARNTIWTMQKRSDCAEEHYEERLYYSRIATLLLENRVKQLSKQKNVFSRYEQLKQTATAVAEHVGKDVCTLWHDFLQYRERRKTNKELTSAQSELRETKKGLETTRNALENMQRQYARAHEQDEAILYDARMDNLWLENEVKRLEKQPSLYELIKQTTVAAAERVGKNVQRMLHDFLDYRERRECDATRMELRDVSYALKDAQRAYETTRELHTGAAKDTNRLYAENCRLQEENDLLQEQLDHADHATDAHYELLKKQLRGLQERAQDSAPQSVFNTIPPQSMTLPPLTMSLPAAASRQEHVSGYIAFLKEKHKNNR